jgi:hypothetical protein
MEESHYHNVPSFPSTKSVHMSPKIRRKPLPSVDSANAPQMEDPTFSKQSSVHFLQHKPKEVHPGAPILDTPRRLGYFGFSLASEWITHVLMFLLVLPFLLLAVVVISIHRRPVDHHQLYTLEQSSNAVYFRVLPREGLWLNFHRLRRFLPWSLRRY